MTFKRGTKVGGTEWADPDRSTFRLEMHGPLSIFPRIFTIFSLASGGLGMNMNAMNEVMNAKKKMTATIIVYEPFQSDAPNLSERKLLTSEKGCQSRPLNLDSCHAPKK